MLTNIIIDDTEYGFLLPPLRTVSGTAIIDQSLSDIIEDAARRMEGGYYEDYQH